MSDIIFEDRFAGSEFACSVGENSYAMQTKEIIHQLTAYHIPFSCCAMHHLSLSHDQSISWVLDLAPFVESNYLDWRYNIKLPFMRLNRCNGIVLLMLNKRVRGWSLFYFRFIHIDLPTKKQTKHHKFCKLFDPVLIECDEFRIWVFVDVHRRLPMNSMNTIQKKKWKTKQITKMSKKKKIKAHQCHISVNYIHLWGSNKKLCTLRIEVKSYNSHRNLIHRRNIDFRVRPSNMRTNFQALLQRKTVERSKRCGEPALEMNGNGQIYVRQLKELAHFMLFQFRSSHIRFV